MTRPTGRRSRRGDLAESGHVAPIAWSAAQAIEFLVRPGPNDNKLRRGVLALRTGSAAYPGAAVLGAEAAWRTGVGLLRFVSPQDDEPPHSGLPTPAAAVLAARPETVFLPGDRATADIADAWVVGSGTDPARRSTAETEALARLLGGTAPVVVDAGALGLVAEPRHGGTPPAAPCILTPHRGEFLTLWAAAELGERPDGWPVRGRGDRDRALAPPVLAAAAARLAARLGHTVLLKGSVTHVATPLGAVFVTAPATPWLATAGTGDVLAGILGALVAAHADAVREDPELLGPLGASAAALHDAAARTASGDPLALPPSGVPGGGPITAADVARALPVTLRGFLEGLDAGASGR